MEVIKEDVLVEFRFNYKHVMRNNMKHRIVDFLIFTKFIRG